MGYVGHLLILLAGTGLGFWLSHRLCRQEQYLEQAIRLLQAVEQQVTFSPRPMAEIWQQLAASPEFSQYLLLQETASRLSEMGFGVAYSGAVEMAFARGQLTPSGRQLLLEFGAGCGLYDLVRQTAHIRHYRNGLVALREDLHRQVTEKSRLYRVLGMAGGGALALMLL